MDGDRADDDRIAEIIPVLHEEIGRLPRSIVRRLFSVILRG